MGPASIIHEEYRRARGEPFAWGTSDCLGWAAAVAIRLVGRDPIAGLRGRYHSEVSAARVMVEEGWRSLGDVAAAHAREIPVLDARTGDWAYLINDDGTATIGVFIADQVAAKALSGVGIMPRARALRAFRVE